MKGSIYLDVFLHYPVSSWALLSVFGLCMALKLQDLKKHNLCSRFIVTRLAVFPLLFGALFFLVELAHMADQIYKGALLKSIEVIFFEALAILPILVYSIVYSIVLNLVDLIVIKKRNR